MASRVPKSQKRHGNLSPKASQVYEDLRQDRGYSKKKAAKIANAVANGTVNHKRGGRRKKKKKG
jgi:hypothetical protein